MLIWRIYRAVNKGPDGLLSYSFRFITQFVLTVLRVNIKNTNFFVKIIKKSKSYHGCLSFSTPTHQFRKGNEVSISILKK